MKLILFVMAACVVVIGWFFITHRPHQCTWEGCKRQGCRIFVQDAPRYTDQWAVDTLHWQCPALTPEQVEDALFSPVAGE